MRALHFVLVPAFFLSVEAARAGQSCVSASSTSAPTSYAQLVDLAKFDAALGVLTAVSVEVTGTVTGQVRLESLEPQPYTATTTFSADVGTWRPDHSGIVGVSPTRTFVDALSAFDGIIDFGGTSGFTHAGILATTSNTTVLTSAGDLALFSGPSGAPGTIQIIATAILTAYVSGLPSPLPAFAQDAVVGIRICYDYTPFVSSYCSGDGSGTACPCGNQSVPGQDQGCLHSFGSGAALRGVGTPSVAADTLVLTCSNLPATTTGLFFQGNALVSSGAGTAFGDGLRCAGGFVVRLAAKTAVLGVMTYPEVGDAPISVRGSAPANWPRYYQAWYRNSASFCTSSAFNLSQGLAVLWAP